MKTINKLWILVMVLAIISPLGIIIPRYFKSGPAWGEARLSSLWNAPIQDYGSGNAGYIFSAIIGIALIAGAILVVGKFFKTKE